MTWVDPTPGPQVRGLDDEYIRRALESISHSASIIHVGPNSPVTAAGGAAVNLPPWKRWFDTTNKLDKIWSPTHSKWITLTPQGARVDTRQTRNNAAYGDLTTVGPTVTIDTGTSVLLSLHATCDGDVDGFGARMGVAVSGASTIAAATASAAVADTVGTSFFTISRYFLFTGLTAGSNIFTAKYSADTTTGFAGRDLIVQAIPT